MARISLRTQSFLKIAKKELKSGNTEKPIAILSEVLRVFPRNSVALSLARQLSSSFNLSIDNASETAVVLRLYQKNEIEFLCDLYRDFLNYKPTSNATLYHCLGAAYFTVGDPERSAAFLEQACAIAPDNLTIKNDLASAYVRLGHHQQAISIYKEVIRQKPNWAEVLANYGTALNSVGETDAAIAVLEKSIGLNSNTSNSHIQLAEVYRSSGRDSACIRTLEQAIKINPQNQKALSFLGEVLFLKGHTVRATQYFRQAAEIEPNNADYWSNLATAQFELKQLADARNSVNNALSLAPEHGAALSLIVSLKLKACDMFEVEETAQRAGDMLSVMSEMYLFDRPERRLELAASALSRLNAKGTATAPLTSHNPGEKIKIGYFSADFRDHPTSQLIEGVLRHHDRSRFEIHAFSFWTGPRDEVTQVVHGLVDAFHDVSALADAEVASLSNELEIDVAVDLMGHCALSRPGVFFHRPAPVHVNFLGFPGSFGSSVMDYIIADDIVVPEQEEESFSESIKRLAGSFFPYNDAETVSAEQFEKKDFGIPENAFVFCGFHNSMKITPKLFRSWCEILNRTADSILWLLDENPTVRQNILAAAADLGVDSNRIVFSAKMKRPKHLARLRLADVYLDTFNYGAHTTGADALFVGLPMITCAGRSFSSRVGASLLSAAGVNELVSDNSSEYIELAVRAYEDHAWLAEQRSGISAAIESGLFNSAQYTARLESALEACHQASTLAVS